MLRPTTALAGLLLLTVLVYLPGLNGPFLFDDTSNIVRPFSAWLNGQTGWQDILLGNGAGLLGRPLSLLTFLANASISGLNPLPFKVTNLAIHLACGVLLYLLLAHLLTRDPVLKPRSRVAALIVAALWLLHPLQVSTVLYVVQRMAQLSAMFILLALLLFVLGRLALLEGRTRHGLVYLFILLPAATLAAMFSKENGALVPLLCAVVELGYFRASTQEPRPLSVKLFFVVSLIAPGILAIAWYALHPQRLLGGYEGRLFTLGERLLSEPRALMDYMGALLLPRGPSLGVYTDDFAVSHGLLDPPTTLFAILGLIALIGVAWAARNRAPAFFTGIGLYLAGQAMESTVFPLELYFEHRNYLPSAGFFLAAVGATAWLLPRLAAQSDNPARLRRLLASGGIGALILLSAATFARASVWGSWPVLAAQGARQHPQSMRAQLDHASVLQMQGRYAETQQVFDHMATMDSPEARHAAAIDRVALKCMTDGSANPNDITRIDGIAGAKLQLGEMLAFENLANYLQKHDCANLGRSQLATLIVAVVNAAPQPGRLTQIWRSRFVAAELYAIAGDLPHAQEQAALAWMTGSADTAVGVYLATIYEAEGDRTSARLIVGDVRKHMKTWDVRNEKLVKELQQKLAQPIVSPADATTP